MKKFLAIVAILVTVTVSTKATTSYSKELYNSQTLPQTYCLALNIYHEARSDNLAGKYAVSDVVLNRVKSTRYPNTICEVVRQGPVKPSWKDPSNMIPIRHKCQFSWYCDGKDDTPLDADAWLEAQEIAYLIVELDNFVGISEGATHYHATYVDPVWNKKMQHVGRIGSHLFFRQP